APSCVSWSAYHRHDLLCSYSERGMQLSCSLFRQSGFVHAFAALQETLGSHAAEQLRKGSDDSRPPSLMAGADAGAVITVKVFVKGNEVAPMGVILELLGSPIDGTMSIRAAQKDSLQAVHELLAHLIEVHLLSGARWTLNLKAVAIIQIELQQGVDHEHLHRHPDRSAPVGIAAIHAVVRLRGSIIHTELLTTHI